MAVLVIAIHSSFTNFLDINGSGYTFSLVIQRIFLSLGDAAVPTFIVISGYLLFSKFVLKEYPRMLLKKLFSLVIPYFIWSILGFILLRLIVPLFTHEVVEFTFKSVVLDILLSNGCPQIWFIRPLVVYFICSPILYFIFKYLKKWSIFIPIAIFIIYIFFRPNYYGIAFWIPLFFIGSYLSYFDIPIFNRYRPRLFSIISLVILLLVASLISGFNVNEENTIYFIYRHISVILLWISLDILYTLFYVEEIKEIFKISAFIFFVHYFFTHLIQYLLMLGISINNYNCVLMFFLTWIISSIISISLGYVLKRFANPVYRVIAGRK